MADRTGFQGKLSGIMELAKEKGNRLSLEEVECYFEEERLSEEQIGLVCDYLLSSKVTVVGYEKKPGIIKERGNADREEASALTAEEEEYLGAYLNELAQMHPADGQEARMVFYLPLVAEEAVKLAGERASKDEVFLEDLIQEGNVGLIEALGSIKTSPEGVLWEAARKTEPGEAEKEAVLAEARASMKMLLASQQEAGLRDRKMVEQVSELDERIRAMKEELGRKVSVDEVAEHLGTTEEHIRDILKLAGEEVKEEEE